MKKSRQTYNTALNSAVQTRSVLTTDPRFDLSVSIIEGVEPLGVKSASWSRRRRSLTDRAPAANRSKEAMFSEVLSSSVNLKIRTNVSLRTHSNKGLHQRAGVHQSMYPSVDLFSALLSQLV